MSVTNQPELRRRLEAQITYLERLADRLERELFEPGDDDSTLADICARARAEAESVRAAIHRIADGTYGHCTECGALIPDRRLAAIPVTDRCADCARISKR